MDSDVRAAKLDQAFELVRCNGSLTTSRQIATHVLDLRLRDKRQMRRAVRRLLVTDDRFQEVHAGLWETLNHDYGEQVIEDTEFRVLDLEVTGSDPSANGIIDLAVFAVQGEQVRPLLSTLVNPCVPIPTSIQRLTGINESMVRDAPVFEDVLPQVLQLFENTVLVAHNATFDYVFLKTCIERVTGERFTLPSVCTVKLSQRLLDPASGSRKLHSLAREFGIPLKNRHRAYDDAFATAHILVELKRRLGALGITTLGALKKFECGLAVQVPLPQAPNPDLPRGARPIVPGV